MTKPTLLSATLLSKKKPQPFGCGHYVGITDLSRVGQRVVLAKKVSSGHFPPELQMEQKETAHFRVRYVLALPIFPGSRPPSIVGANELNFCVRDGNRWTLIAINTNSYGWGLPHLLYQCPVRLFAACEVW